MATARRGLWDPSSDQVLIEKPAAPQRTTRDVLRTANEINQIADATVSELGDHGKRLEALQDKVAGIGDKLNTTDRLIHEIGSFWTRVANKFRSGPNVSEHSDRRAEWEEEHRAHMAAKATAAPIAAPPLPTTYADDEDGDLDAIYDSVLRMKHSALVMGSTLEDHNRRLDHLNTETELATARISTSNRKVGELIKRA